MARTLGTQWEIDVSKLKKIKELGHGQFVQIYLAEWGKQKVAVKELRTGKGDYYITSELRKYNTIQDDFYVMDICTWLWGAPKPS